MLSKRALRKIRRKQENQFYERIARFWLGKIKSADRILYTEAINAQSYKDVLTNNQIEKFEGNYKKLHE